ncbi:MAG TPA: hypothetical protein VKA32_04410 [Gammaproteobacteria bacterium]|nr:hypothetical protein [Gammaproteobacteria bacterium]
MAKVSDYLAVESALIAQIKAIEQGFKAVLGAADLQGLQQRQQITPAAHVVYQGDDLPTGSQDRGVYGKPQRVMQRWIVAVAVRNVRGIRQGTAVREEAGPLMATLIEGLEGWQPPSPFRPLKRAPSPPPWFSEGFAYFPLLFTTEVIL